MLYNSKQKWPFLITNTLITAAIVSTIALCSEQLSAGNEVELQGAYKYYLAVGVVFGILSSIWQWKKRTNE
jgi:Na+-driven multidrug efflux pump